MEFNVAQLLKAPAGTVRDYRISQSLDDIEDIDWAAPGEGEVRLVRTGRGVLVRARILSAAHSVCSRCLTPFEHPLLIEFEEEFLPLLDVETGVALTIDEEDATAFTIDEVHTLDLHEAVRQYALLALPMQPICQPDCRGLCPACGANLNLGPCQCAREPLDHRWAALSKLLANDEEKGAS